MCGLLTCNQPVGGSTPLASSIFIKSIILSESIKLSRSLRVEHPKGVRTACAASYHIGA